MPLSKYKHWPWYSPTRYGFYTQTHTTHDPSKNKMWHTLPVKYNVKIRSGRRLIKDLTILIFVKFLQFLENTVIYHGMSYRAHGNPNFPRDYKWAEMQIKKKKYELECLEINFRSMNKVSQPEKK